MIPFVYSSENLPTRERAQQPQRTRTVRQTRVQLASTQHFHDEVHRVRRLVDFVQLDNVRVVETTKNKHLLEESLSLGRVGTPPCSPSSWQTWLPFVYVQTPIPDTPIDHGADRSRRPGSQLV